MEPTYLFPQEPNKPLFSDVVWSRPEQRAQAGKLALIGGSVQGFNSVSIAYAAAISSGVGTIRTLLPDGLRKVVSHLLPESEFAPSTKTGSFGAKALTECLDLDKWADGVLICGDLGRNSETAVLLERFIEEGQSLLSLAGDSVDVLSPAPVVLLSSDRLTITAELTQLQKLLSAIRYPMAIKSQMTLYQLAGLLHALTLSYPWAVITEHLSQFFVAYSGKVSTTPKSDQALTSAAAVAAVWRLQQPSKTFEAISSGVGMLAG